MRPKIKEESGAEMKLVKQFFKKVAEAFPPHIGESVTKNEEKIESKVR